MSIRANPIGNHIDRISHSNVLPLRNTGHILSVDNLRAFRPILSFLNAKDRDILYLVFVSGKKQKEVQDIMGRSQPSLCYDIKRIRKRLRYIFYLNSVFDIFINFVSSPPEQFSTFEINVLVAMFYTSSFTLSAEILSRDNSEISQVRVRYSFDKCLRKMEENKIWEIYEIFMVVRTNLNMVKRVCRKENECFDVYIPS